MRVPSDANNLVNEGQPFTAQASDGQFRMVLGGHREISKAATTKEAPKTHPTRCNRSGGNRHSNGPNAAVSNTEGAEDRENTGNVCAS